METGAASQAYRRVVDNVRRVIAGNDDAVETATLCLFADGNLLLEGVPGVGKTTLARALAVVDRRHLHDGSRPRRTCCRRT